MIRNNDPYGVSAYELGFEHAKMGIEKGNDCCHEYALGYQSYEATK